MAILKDLSCVLKVYFLFFYFSIKVFLLKLLEFFLSNKQQYFLRNVTGFEENLFLFHHMNNITHFPMLKSLQMLCIYNKHTQVYSIRETCKQGTKWKHS